MNSIVPFFKRQVACVIFCMGDAGLDNKSMSGLSMCPWTGLKKQASKPDKHLKLEQLARSQFKVLVKCRAIFAVTRTVMDRC